MTDADNVLNVKIEAASRLYDQNDPAFLQQVSTLRRDISEAGIQALETELPGRKGGTEIAPVVQVVVAGGSGLVALCGVVKLWIKQRGDRLIRLTVRGTDDRDRVLAIDGRNVSDETLAAFAKEFSVHFK